MEPTVIVSHVSKSFGGTKAVEDVSFEVFGGEIFGLLGPNGAGKTTTIRIMLGIFGADAGQVSILGGPLTMQKLDSIGYLPEERGLYRDQRLDSTLLYFATLKGMSRGAAEDRLTEWLRRMDLLEYRTRKVQELSKGMQQKAQLIATLLHEPEILIIDEPFTGLDPVNTRLVKDIIEEQRRAGRTIIMSTHQMYQVEALCSRIVLVNRGRGVLYGDVEGIRRRFAGNAVSVTGQGDFSKVPGVLEARKQNGEWRMSLGTGVSPQQVLRALVERDGVRIDRFEVVEPSLDDIFIKVVTEGGEQVDAATAAQLRGVEAPETSAPAGAATVDADLPVDDEDLFEGDEELSELDRELMRRYTPGQGRRGG